MPKKLVSYDTTTGTLPPAVETKLGTEFAPASVEAEVAAKLDQTAVDARVRAVGDPTYAPASVADDVATKLDQTQVDARVLAVGDATYAPTDVVESAGVIALPDSSGLSLAAADANGNLSWFAVDNTGGIPRHTADAMNKAIGTSTVTIPNACHEWWILDAYTWLPTEQRMIATVYGTDGSIRACEWRPGMGLTVNVVVGSTPIVDDHNAPGHWVKPGRRAVLCWQRHANDNKLRVAVSASGPDVASWQDSTIIEATIADEVSYGSPLHIASLSDTTQDTFWIPVRVAAGVSWRFQQISVNQATGAVTVGPIRYFVQSSGGQFYCSFADANKTSGNQVLRVAAYHNPAMTDNHIWYMEIDCVTGDVTSPVHNAGASFHNVLSAVADTQLNGNQAAPAITPILAHNASVDRRMFYVSAGPFKPRVAYAEWAAAAPDAAMYKVYDVQAGTTKDIATAGTRFGYTAEANYLAGMCFESPAVDDTVYVARNLTVKTIERYWTGRGAVTMSKILAASTTTTPIRPLCAKNNGPALMFFDMRQYSDFAPQGDVRSVNAK